MSDLERQLRAYYDEVVHRIDPFSPGDLRPEPARRPPRGWVAAGVAAVSVLIVGAVTTLLIGRQPEEAGPAATTLPLETITAPSETTMAAPDEPPALFSPVGMETFGDFTLVWNEHDIWRYENGEWSLYAEAPGDPSDLAYTSETLWAISGSSLRYLDGGTWRGSNIALPAQAWRIAADPGTDVLWVSSSDDLYRWDGTALISAGHPPTWEAIGDAGDGYVGDIAVTSDGSVWSAGLNGWIPDLGGLARYDSATDAWEVVRPLGGEDDIPATLMAPTAEGDLWVILADWSRDWEAREAAGEPVAVLTLARYNGATGEWEVYDEELPAGYPTHIASGGDTVWVSLGNVGAGVGEVNEIARFDGRTWTTYLEDLPVDDTVDDLAVAADGTVWYTVNGEIHQLVP